MTLPTLHLPRSFHLQTKHQFLYYRHSVSIFHVFLGSKFESLSKTMPNMKKESDLRIPRKPVRIVLGPKGHHEALPGPRLVFTNAGHKGLPRGSSFADAEGDKAGLSKSFFFACDNQILLVWICCIDLLLSHPSTHPSILLNNLPSRSSCCISSAAHSMAPLE